MYDPAIRQYNLNRLYNYLRINNIPKESIKKFTKGNGLAIEIQRNVLHQPILYRQVEVLTQHILEKLLDTL